MSLVLITLGLLALLLFVTLSLSYISDPMRLDQEAHDDAETEYEYTR